MSIYETVKDCLDEDKKFNAYETTCGRFIVAIGPLEDYTVIAIVDNPNDANALVDALRAAAGQEKCLCPVDWNDEGKV